MEHFTGLALFHESLEGLRDMAIAAVVVHHCCHPAYRAAIFQKVRDFFRSFGTREEVKRD